ncbi:unnamed protein product [Durusdinium trenchii]|uniref:non-specific serine/threonine protein kinase n=1 Tax=Durusdinium trenchii TaxID=1381693 RepID=A0ABP0NBC6_9DINO
MGAAFCVAPLKRTAGSIIDVVFSFKDSYTAEMELLEGDLHGAIHAARGVEPAFAGRILANLVSGLRYLHDSHDMVHLDIKPANVFLTAGVAKLGDFGLCCSKAQAAALLGPCGTPEYLPGDVWHEEVRCSERNDIWGAGCMLFEMLEGKMAFDNPPLPGQELPHCTAKGWNSYGGTLSNVWRQLMSTPTAKQSLSIVGDLLKFDMENYTPTTGSQIERMAKKRGLVNSDIKRQANLQRKKRRREAKKRRRVPGPVDVKEDNLDLHDDDGDDADDGGDRQRDDTDEPRRHCETTMKNSLQENWMNDMTKFIWNQLSISCQLSFSFEVLICGHRRSPNYFTNHFKA